jgi:hypothetical protein
MKPIADSEGIEQSGFGDCLRVDDTRVFHVDLIRLEAFRLGAFLFEQLMA